ncbi:Hypothetical protein GL50581_2455 [Giardia duodenalis ATCC 50581]|nr:Hypothetical protein GL50581_2455 [Giardia intestinalis ATCC 50581]
MSVIEAKLNDSLAKAVQSGQDKRYSDAITALVRLLSIMDQWFHAEPAVHRIYFRTYYRVLKACIYGDMGLYHWLNDDALSASLALKQSIQMLPTHLSLQRLSYLAVRHNDTDAAIHYLLRLVSDPILSYDKVTSYKGTCATHPSEALALRAAITAYYGNIVEGINLISLALSYHSQTAAEIAIPLVCTQLRAGLPPRVITKIPDLTNMSSIEIRKYHLLLRVFVSLCKIAVDRCVKLPIVVNCDIRNILNHVLGEFHKLVISNVIFDPTGLYQVLLDKYLSIGGSPSAVKVCMESKEYLLDLYSFAFPWMWDVQVVIRSFTDIMRENAFTDTVWTLLSVHDKKASRRAIEAGIQALSRKKIIEETALAEYVYNMHGLQLAPLFTSKPHGKNRVDLAKISRAGPGEAVKSVMSVHPSNSEVTSRAFTHHTHSSSDDSLNSYATETKESLMKTFQKAVQARKHPSTPKHLAVTKSPTVASAAPIRSMDLSGLHVCPSPAELAVSLADTVLGQPIVPLDTLWTNHASTCQECKDPKPTYQTRRIVDEADVKACVEGHQSIIQQVISGIPYSTGLSGIYNGEVERVRNTSVLSRFMLGSTIRAVNESAGEPIKPFSKKCRKLAKTLQTTTQDYDFDTASEKPAVKSDLTDPIDLSADDLFPVHIPNSSTEEPTGYQVTSAVKPKVPQRRAQLSIPLAPTSGPHSSPTCSARTISARRVQEANNQIVKAAPRSTEAAKPTPELSVAMLPQQNLLTGKVVLDYITGKEMRQAESIYANIGLATAILDRASSTPTTERHASRSSVEKADTIAKTGYKDRKIDGVSVLQDKGTYLPAYLDTITYQAAFTPRGAADTIEISSPISQLPLPERIDLFQYCDTEPSKAMRLSAAVSEYIERPAKSISPQTTDPEAATIDHKRQLRPYHNGLDDYLVEHLPRTPPRPIPKLVTNVKSLPRDALNGRGRQKTVAIHQLTSSSNASLSHFTGKTISALLMRPKKPKK